VQLLVVLIDSWCASYHVLGYIAVYSTTCFVLMWSSSGRLQNCFTVLLYVVDCSKRRDCVVFEVCVLISWYCVVSMDGRWSYKCLRLWYETHVKKNLGIIRV
jgi:hypothetical protein